MPNYKGHLIGGLIAYLSIIAVCISIRPSLVTSCEWLFFTLAGALFPDIDVKSKGQKYFYYIIFILFFCLMYQGKFQLLSCLSFITITPMLSRHRGVFHSVWLIVLMPIVLWGFISMLFPYLMKPLLINTLFFIVGGLSHILLDCSMSWIVRTSGR